MSAVLFAWCSGQSLSVAPMGAACVLPEPPAGRDICVFPLSHSYSFDKSTQSVAQISLGL